MKLQQELNLPNPIKSRAHEALLNVYHTASRLKKTADEFFREHGLTDVQFNMMVLLVEQAGSKDGLTQVELSRMMLVNRANITSLIDRMESAGHVRRAPVPGDRRYNIVQLTDRGRTLYSRVEADYMRHIEQIMSGLSAKELDQLIGMLERIRGGLETTGAASSQAEG